MANVFFSLREGLNATDLDKALAEVKALPGVEVVGQLLANARKPQLRSKCFARVESEETAMSLLDTLLALPDVVSAGLPEKRGLL